MPHVARVPEADHKVVRHHDAEEATFSAIARKSPHTRPLLLAPFLSAGPAAGQVRVDARLEKPRHLVGEPVIVIVDVHNIGDEPVG